MLYFGQSPSKVLLLHISIFVLIPVGPPCMMTSPGEIILSHYELRNLIWQGNLWLEMTVYGPNRGH